MSLAAFYEASVLSALTDILAYVQPPQLAGPSSSAAFQGSGSGSHGQPEPSSSPDPAAVSIRWPSLPASRQQLVDALTLHDLLVLLIHAAIVQHGAVPSVPPQQTEQQPAAATSSAAFATAAVRSPSFIPNGWNSSRSGYRLRYSFSTPISHPSAASSDNSSAAEVLTADSSIVYELRLLLLPLSHYLVIDANMQHVSAVDGASSAISANHKLTLDVLNYVSVDELYGCVTRWMDRVRGQQPMAGDEASDYSTPLTLSAWVYRDVALLLTAVSNAIIKRCMGPLWPTFFAPNSLEDRFLSPSLPALPVDLQLSILLYLPSVALARLSAVSAAMSVAASHPLLWQWLCSVELDMSDRSLVAKDDWKSEFVIRRQRKREEMIRNRFALVPVGLPIDVRDDTRLGVGGARGERPFFRLPFPLQPHALDDPLRFREWRRTGFGGWTSGGYRM